MKEAFRKFSFWISQVVGTPFAFGLALSSVIIWASTGHIFNYSEDWQLVINTGTTIITFLMVFLIQSAQNRDSKAIHMKLNELIRAVKGARNELVDLEEASDEELELMHHEFKEFHDRIREKIHERNQKKVES